LPIADKPASEKRRMDMDAVFVATTISSTRALDLQLLYVRSIGFLEMS
jgi:hypothetical protein